MSFEKIEFSGLDGEPFDLNVKKDFLRSDLQSRYTQDYAAFLNMPEGVDGNISRWLDIRETTEVSRNTYAIRPFSVMETAKQMYNGVDIGDGNTTLGLKDIHNWKTNPDYFTQNLKQHAGYSAEVIGTAKENILADYNETGLKTFRADDRPDLFQRNDQYVDKIRVNSSGEIIDRIQVKFVGKDPADCLSKLASKKFDKYFNDGKINKMEVPKDYYSEIKGLIPGKISELEEQLKHVKENGKTEAANGIEARIDRYQRIDQMLEQSTVTSDEAIYATQHPKRYVAKLFAENAFVESHKAGIESAAIAATITAATSTVDNVLKVMEGEVTAQEAFVDTMKDTGAAGGLAYGTVFVSTAVSQAMSGSCHQLIRSLGKTGVPAAVISFGVESFDSVNDFANGIIDEKELAYDLGENAAQIGGSIAGAALAGAAVGSIVPGAGTAVGFATGLVGGMVGCAVASEAYVSAVEFGAEHAQILADKAQEMAAHTIEIATEVIPDQVGNVVSSINDFVSEFKLPFSF